MGNTVTYDSKLFTQIANSATRIPICKIRIYFDEPIGIQEYTKYDYIKDVNILIENSVESNFPFGNISSNECIITLKNTDRIFSVNNTTSPLYNYLVSDLKVEVFLGFVYENKEIYTHAGVYWTNKWISPSDSVITTLYCYDILSRIGSLNLPKLTIPDKTNFYEVFDLLFAAIGLKREQYKIDEYLTTFILNNIILQYNDVKSCLQQLAIGSLSRIYTDNLGIIHVLYMYRWKDPKYHITEHDQIISIKNTSNYNDIYDKIAVSYYVSCIEKEQVVASLNNVYIDIGTTYLTGIKFTQNYVRDILYVIFSCDSNKKLYAYIEEVDSVSISLCIVNKGEPCAVNISVIGNYINNHELIYKLQNYNSFMQYDREITLKNSFVQSFSYAQDVAAAVLAYTEDANKIFDISIRGNPLYNLNDVVEIDDNRYGYSSLRLIINRMKYTFNGALKCELQCQKLIYPKTYIMISPGFFAEYPYNYVDVITEDDDADNIIVINQNSIE